MTLRTDIATQQASTAPGHPAASILGQTSLHSGISTRPADPDSPDSDQTSDLRPPASEKCPCGAPVDPDLLALRHLFPSQAPALCTACYEVHRSEEEARDRAEMENATHRRRLAELDRVIPPELLQTRLAHPGFNPALWNQAAGWDPATGRWLLITGDPGLCKTRVVALIAKRLILDRGTRVSWCRATHLQTTCEELWVKDRLIQAAAYARLREWHAAELLILDDLGKNTWSDLLESKLFDLIDHRKSHHLTTIVTANTPLDELLDHLTPDRGGPIIGRILEAARGWTLKAR